MTDDGPFEELAGWLVIPDRSGVYLTRNEIVMLARLEGASLRYGERRRMLVDVLRSASTPEELRSMVGRLQAAVGDSLARYRALVAELPAAAEVLGPWIERAARTEQRLVELAEDLSEGSPG